MVKRAKVDAESKVSVLCVHVCSYPMAEVNWSVGEESQGSSASKPTRCSSSWERCLQGSSRARGEGGPKVCCGDTPPVKENRGGGKGRNGHSSKGGNDSPPLTDGDGRR